MLFEELRQEEGLLRYYVKPNTKEQKLYFWLFCVRFGKSEVRQTNLMQTSKSYCFCSFALGSAHVKFDV